jgi:hypothetical protein
MAALGTSAISKPGLRLLTNSLMLRPILTLTLARTIPHSTTPTTFLALSFPANLTLDLIRPTHSTRRSTDISFSTHTLKRRFLEKTICRLEIRRWKHRCEGNARDIRCKIFPLSHLQKRLSNFPSSTWTNGTFALHQWRRNSRFVLTSRRMFPIPTSLSHRRKRSLPKCELFEIDFQIN